MRNPKLSAAIFILAILFLVAPAAQGGRISAPGARSTISAVVSAASYYRVLTPGAIATVFGYDLSEATYSANSLPLPTRLGGTSLRLIQRDGDAYEAKLFYVSPGQINFLVPRELGKGECQILVSDDFMSAFSAWVPVTETAPGLFTANSLGYGAPAGYVLRVRGSQEIIEPIATYSEAEQRYRPIPIDLSRENDQVFLILFGTGVWRPGTKGLLAAAIVDETVPIAYAGPTPGFEGLDQVNIRLSHRLAAKGEVSLIIETSAGVSNPVTISVR